MVTILTYYPENIGSRPANLNQHKDSKRKNVLWKRKAEIF